MFYSFGCSTQSSSASTLEQDQFSSSLGVSYRAEFAGVIRVFIEGKHQYVIIREEESSREIYIETDWKDRTLFQDEINQKILGARTRLIFRARVRHAGQYTIHMYADNEVIRSGTDIWQTGSFSPMLKEMLNDIARELRIEYKVLF
jgi:hypothetical protein